MWRKKKFFFSDVWCITVKNEEIIHLSEIEIIVIARMRAEWSWLLNRVFIEQKHFLVSIKSKVKQITSSYTVRNTRKETKESQIL